MSSSLSPVDLAQHTDPSCYKIPYRACQAAVVSTSCLLEQADCDISLGVAPDGLPLIMHVKRNKTITPCIENRLAASIIELKNSMGEAFCEHLNGIDRMLTEKCSKVGIFESEDELFYLPNIPLKNIVGDTVLSRLLLRKSPREQLSNCSFHDSHPQKPSVLGSVSYSPSSPSYVPDRCWFLCV